MNFRLSFYQAIIGMLSLSTITSCGHQAAKEDPQLSLLIGTYTNDCDSRGVYLYRFDQQTGKSIPVSHCQIENPSFICLSPDRKLLYSVSENHDAKAAANATEIDLKSGTFGVTHSAYTSSTGSGGEDPCNIWTDGRFVVTANYSGGSLSIFALNDHGTRPELHQFLSFEGLREGAISHIHCALPTPDGRYLLVTDLGNDCIYRFTLHPNAQKGEPYLTDQTLVFQGETGSGPRHFCFSHHGKYLYLINELSGTLVVMNYQDGTLTPQQTIMAEEVPAHGSADIHLSPDGRFLYASHRLQNDGLSIYCVDSISGNLTKQDYQPTAAHPRNFILTPNGKYLLVASRDNNKIEVYSRNPESGLLTLTPDSICLPKPVCLLFAEVPSSVNR